MAKAIIFDFWGTLIDEGVYPSLMRQTKYFMGLRDMQFHDFILKFEDAVMLKRFEDKKDAFAAAFAAFGLEHKPWQMEKLIGLWNRVTLFSKPYDETLEVLADLKKDHKLILMSNGTNFTNEAVMDKFKMRGFFDGIYVSYDTGHLKSDKKIFEKALKEHKLKKDDVVMVGDSIESDMKAAEAAGIKGILVDRREKREYPLKIRSLVQLKEIMK